MRARAYFELAGQGQKLLAISTLSHPILRNSYHTKVKPPGRRQPLSAAVYLAVKDKDFKRDYTTRCTGWSNLTFWNHTHFMHTIHTQTMVLHTPIRLLMYGIWSTYVGIALLGSSLGLKLRLSVSRGTYLHIIRTWMPHRLEEATCILFNL